MQIVNRTMLRQLTICLIAFFAFISCKKNNSQPAADWFLIEIKTPVNADCSVPEIIFIDRKDEAYRIIGNSQGVYVASGLPKVLFSVGARMYVTIQKPDATQLMACTTMGPSYPQVHINTIK